jgi:hypothetical protein
MSFVFFPVKFLFGVLASCNKKKFTGGKTKLAYIAGGYKPIYPVEVEKIVSKMNHKSNALKFCVLSNLFISLFKSNTKDLRLCS